MLVTLILIELLGLLGSVSSYDPFDEYVILFQKVYTDVEYTIRNKLYEDRIASFANITDFVPGVNNFTDWNEEEIKSKL